MKRRSSVVEQPSPDSPPAASTRVAVLVEKSRAYGRALCEGIASFANEQGDWTLELIDDLATKDFQAFRGCAGVIARIVNDGAAAALKAFGVPVVDILVLKRYDGVAAVDSDQRLVGAWAAENLIGRRFARFAFCGYSGAAFSDARGEGFARTLASKGYACQTFLASERRMLELAKRGISREHLTLDSDRGRLASWLRALPKPVAVFCCHDARAYQVLTLCKRLGLRVPDEVAVMGVDDDRILCGFASPMLSSIDPNAFEIGRSAARLLADLIARPRASRNASLVVPPKALITRASTQVYPVSPAWLSDALVFIGRNYAKGINADDVFRHVRRSHTGVERAFRDVLHTSVHKQVLKMRVEAAAQLLRSTVYPACTIAAMTGFSSPQHFSYAFRRAYRQTPESFRNRAAASALGELQIS